MGDVTVYKVDTPGGHKIEALLANSAAGRTNSSRSAIPSS